MRDDSRFKTINAIVSIWNFEAGFDIVLRSKEMFSFPSHKKCVSSNIKSIIQSLKTKSLKKKSKIPLEFIRDKNVSGKH